MRANERVRNGRIDLLYLKHRVLPKKNRELKFLRKKVSKLIPIAEGKCLAYLEYNTMIGDTLITNVDFDKFNGEEIILYVDVLNGKQK